MGQIYSFWTRFVRNLSIYHESILFFIALSVLIALIVILVLNGRPAKTSQFQLRNGGGNQCAAIHVDTCDPSSSSSCPVVLVPCADRLDQLWRMTTSTSLGHDTTLQHVMTGAYVTEEGATVGHTARGGPRSSSSPHLVAVPYLSEGEEEEDPTVFLRIHITSENVYLTSIPETGHVIWSRAQDTRTSSSSFDASRWTQRFISKEDKQQFE